MPPMSSVHWTIDEDTRLGRLDVLVAERLDLSRRRAAFLFERGRVALNGRPASKGVVPVVGDRIAVDLDTPHSEVPPLPDFSIVAESERYIAIDKPAGTHCAALRNAPGPNLAEELARRYPSMRALGAPDYGLVHRLDFWTTGALLVAKDAETHSALRAAFSAHRVIKTYLAVCSGDPPDAFAVDVPIGQPGRRAVRVRVGKGRGMIEAKTEFRVLKRGDGAALVEALCRTGARHQVRAHAAQAGFPLFGDALYGGPPAPDGRFRLHARSLEFTKPVEGVETRFRVEPPAGFSVIPD